ncbi:MAG: hypothetical protein WA571_11460, partial [Candidatus Binatus sp.]
VTSAEKTVRGENEFELEKFEARDEPGVRAAHGIYAGELRSNFGANIQPACAGTNRTGGAAATDGEHPAVPTWRGERTV